MKTSVTLACFRVLGNLPFAKEKLKRSHRGKDKDSASSFNNLLLIRSALALPIGNDFRTDSTFSDVVIIVLIVSCRVTVAVGREALVSSKCVCSVKKIFSMFALSSADKLIVPSLFSGGKDNVLSGLLKYFNVFHQSFGFIQCSVIFKVFG